MSIGNKIKQYREERKMTQKDIAEILEVEAATISKYESGMIEPNIESLKRLASTFNITVDELVKDDDEKFDISKINVLDVFVVIRLPFLIFSSIFLVFNDNCTLKL